MPMLQSDSCSKALHYLQRAAANFIAREWRYGAGVSTSGSQPENPGSIPGTATKLLSRLLRFCLKKLALASLSVTSRRIPFRVNRQLLIHVPNPASPPRHLLSLHPCHKSKI
jgi:hypothetical protein